MEFLAKDYLNRTDLESAVKAEVGQGIQKNKDEGHIVKGTRAEMKKLQLSDLSTVFGCKCTITDTPTTQILAEKKKPKKK